MKETEVENQTIKISILGCGWLGLPLGELFVENHFLVKGSTTSIEKLSVLKTKGITPFLILLTEDGITGDFLGFLNHSTHLIIDVPPQLRGENKENFVAKIKHIIPLIEQSTVKKVIFVSSTSVYGDDNSFVTEETKALPDTESGKQLLAVEKLLQKNKNFETTVLRFGGLIGEDRHPIKRLAGKTHLQNPDGPINLIHQKDCMAIIARIIALDCWGEIFNAVAPFHPTREHYYTQKALKLNLPLPEFSHEKQSIGKVISSIKIEEKLQYFFHLNTL